MKELKKEGRESKWRRDSVGFLKVFKGWTEYFCLICSGGFIRLAALAILDGWKYLSIWWKNATLWGKLMHINENRWKIYNYKSP